MTEVAKTKRVFHKNHWDGNRNHAMTRRQFLTSSAIGLAAGATAGFGGLKMDEKKQKFEEYGQYDGLGLAELVRKKEVKSEELLEVAIERIEAINPKINAVVTKAYDVAKKAIESGLPDGPFTGVPFLLKDLGAACKGVRMTFGLKFLANYVPPYDNELVTRYKKAGLVIMGRTNAPEFGLSASTEPVLHGPARNPWNTEHSTGGSSGGAGAVVAARIIPSAHGSDGGGSIRIPSSCCGVFGLKPSRGRMPTGPESGEMLEGFAIEHALSLSVRDSAALLDATSAPEIGAPYGIPAPKRPFLEEVGTDPGKLRIALYTKGASDETHPDCVAAAKETAKLCESLGHIVEEAAPQIDYASLRKAYLLINAAHLAALLHLLGSLIGAKVKAEMVEPQTWAVAESGRKASAVEFAQTKTVINRATRTVANFMTKYDAILTPTLGTPPPKLGYLDTVNLPYEEFGRRLFDFLPFTWLHNVTGLPAMSVPLYWNADNLPIGTQFAGRYADEATLLRLAGQLEQARPWRDRIPPLAR